jgi:hypothetical protein
MPRPRVFDASFSTPRASSAIFENEMVAAHVCSLLVPKNPPCDLVMVFEIKIDTRITTMWVGRDDKGQLASTSHVVLITGYDIHTASLPLHYSFLYLLRHGRNTQNNLCGQTCLLFRFPKTHHATCQW